VSKRLYLPVLLSFVLLGIGCGGGSSNSSNGSGNPVPGISIQVTSPKGAGALDDNQTLAITVQVTNNESPDNSGVTWTVAADEPGGTPGTLTNVQVTSVTYNPPAGIASQSQVTVTATSVTDPTRSATVPISIYPTPTITTTSVDLAAAFVKNDYTCIQTPISGPNSVNQIPCEVNVSGGLAPFSWSLGNTFLPAGLQLSPGSQPNTERIVGQPTTSGVYLFSLTATDSLGGSSTAQLTVNVAPSQLKVTTPTLLAALQNVPYAPVQLQASGGTPPYTWNLAPTSGPLPPGMTLSPAGVLSGTSNSPITAQFALQVMDSQSPVPAQAIFPAPKPAGGALNIVSLGPSPDPQDVCTLPGIQVSTPYAFLFTGFDANGPVTISGSFTSDAQGNLTGEEDIIRTSGVQTAAPLTLGSLIGFGGLGRGCLTLNTASSTTQFSISPTTISSGVNGAFYSDGLMVESDDQNGSGTRGTGFFRLQDSTAFNTASIAGPYAFRFAGWDVSGSRFAMAGTATANSGLITTASADINDGGVLSGALSGGSGTIGSVDLNGRGTATLSIGSSTYNLILYVVDASHLIFNSPQAAGSGHPLIAGEATASVGPFSNATLNNSHIYRFGGTNSGTPDVGVGVLHFDGIGAVSGTAYERSGGTASATAVSQQYSVDSTTGRFTFSGNGVAAIGYVVAEASGVTGYLVGTGAAAGSGVMEFQTNSYPPGYQFGPISGVYGIASETIFDSQTTAFAGEENLAPNGSFTPGGNSYLDSSRPTGVVPFQEFEMFKYLWAPDGSGAFGGNTYMVTNGSKFFSIDISPLNGHPAVVVGQKQQ
jgi:hypothetical protein